MKRVNKNFKYAPSHNFLLSFLTPMFFPPKLDVHQRVELKLNIQKVHHFINNQHKQLGSHLHINPLFFIVHKSLK